MREIITHRAGVPDPSELNNLIRIEVADAYDESGSPPKEIPSQYNAFAKGQDGAFAALKRIEFQKKPAKLLDPTSGNHIGNHADGLSIEAVIAVALDQLQCFQRSKLSCEQNVEAIRCLRESLFWLHDRTRDRVARGVEGKEAP